MARRLDTRSNFISTFATHVSHELKSPLTSIQGAAELLRDDVDAPQSTATTGASFSTTSSPTPAGCRRLARLRDFARAENPVALGATRPSATIAALRSTFASLDIRAGGELDTPLRIAEENAAIIFSNLADNAQRHGGSSLEMSATQQAIC